MKILVVLLFCCGIALASDAVEDCSKVNELIEGMIETTKDNAVVAMLFEMRKIAGILVNFKDMVNGESKFKYSFWRMVQIYQYPKMSEQLMAILKSSDVELDKDTFKELEAGVISTALSHRNLYLTIEQAAAQLKSYPNLIYLTASVDTRTTDLYFHMNRAFYGLLEKSIGFNSNAIPTFQIFHSELSSINEKLEESEFGRALKPLTAFYSELLPTMNKLIEALNNASTLQEHFLHAAIIKINHVYRFGLARVLFKIIIAALEQNQPGNVQTITSVIGSSQMTFQMYISKNREFGFHINDWLKMESYSDFMEKFLAKCIQLEVVGHFLEIQFVKILKTLNISSDIVKSYASDNASEGVDFDMVEDALNTADSYTSQYIQNYIKNYIQIGVELLKDCNHIFHLIRRMLQNVVRKFIQTFEKKELDEEMKTFLKVIVQKLNLEEATHFLRNSNNCENCSSLRIELLDNLSRDCIELMDRLDRIDEKVSDEEIMEIVKSIEIDENDGADEMETDDTSPTIEEAKRKFKIATKSTISLRAQKVCTSLRLIMDHFSASIDTNQMVPSEIYNQLIQSIESIGGLSDQLNAFNTAFVNEIKPLIAAFETISLRFDRLKSLYEVLSRNPAENRGKLIILYRITEKLADGFKFADARNILSYVVLYLNDPQSNTSLALSSATGIQTLCKDLENHMGDLSDVIENGSVDIILWERIWTLNMGYSIKKGLISILEALPAPAQNQYEVHAAFTNLRRIIVFEPFTTVVPKQDDDDFLDLLGMGFEKLTIAPQATPVDSNRDTVRASMDNFQNQLRPSNSSNKRSGGDQPPNPISNKSRKRE